MPAIQETRSKDWTVRYWLAPLERTCEEIFATGILIERLTEPHPAPQAAAIGLRGSVVWLRCRMLLVSAGRALGRARGSSGCAAS